MARLEKALNEGQGNELNKMMAPCLSRTLHSALQADATLCAVRILLALRVKQLETGTLPQKLDAVAELLGGQVPPNPFGGDIQYVVTDNGKPVLTFATLEKDKPLEFGAGSKTYQERRQIALDRINKLLGKTGDAKEDKF
jgi:hypothetical protein